MRIKISTVFLMVALLVPGKGDALDVRGEGYRPGFGHETRAAYGGINPPLIFIVTSLAWSNGTAGDGIRNGVAVKTGSLREAINHVPPSDTGKLILFEVSGTIEATGPYILRVKNRFTTIAGATAPSPGITLKNTTLIIEVSDVFVSHLRVRVGDLPGHDPDNRDGVSLTAGARDVVLDHLSVSWGIDENVQIWGDDVTPSRDVTVSNCIISEALNDSSHPKGKHSKGLLIGRFQQRVAVIGNLFASNVDRNPVLFGASAAVVNNLIYNAKESWGPVAMHGGQQVSAASVVGNVAIKGPNTGSDHLLFLMGPLQGTGDWMNGGVGSELYVHDNICSACDSTTSLPCAVAWDAVIDDNTYRPIIEVGSPPTIAWPGGLAPNPSSSVEAEVLASAGARPIERDAVDTCIIDDVKLRTGQIINSQSDSGGCGPWSGAQGTSRELVNLPSTPHTDSDNDGYTDLEQWLHAYSRLVEGRAAPPGRDAGIDVATAPSDRGGEPISDGASRDSAPPVKDSAGPDTLQRDQAAGDRAMATPMEGGCGCSMADGDSATLALILIFLGACCLWRARSVRNKSTS